ncbi:MAG: hypothetical protein A2651_00430 [Candidatus Yanofskybacteria bacterium RIFCSPHIGHO2_01_FULL_42_12]|uniref:SAM-dependent methyltransferase n=1 Tax=Candidatus Yanofskybacteria bacterium RIFCSPLOWO2_01_FULL_42_49 TaxID=1802694 RepID=A0A1F8GCI4_9BACT|nr:MAG: hypothetical protein A2651_00430 [Candidatus Yanofskybacteria bacterium RIFCSPHIGHO2_01_FULL_42_12]OGN22169.1 MAG: hypothetical protein A2918_03350 [Candidatus Yanofskybacteria bacterium RIFCSPLOWO2_01_FULL_42_49]
MENDKANNDKLSSSFRDPSGFIFYSERTLLRQINLSHKDNFDYFLSSGLYGALLNDDFIIGHEEIAEGVPMSKGGYKIIKPELVPFISYPYEWCFSQLKDAALLTLKIQKKALEFGMSLKDASAYNIQFKDSKPILIDTLSFEKYKEGEPWVAYKQFCQHFLAPLALMSYRDVRLSQLFRIYIDGVPLDLASSLLPLKTRFILSILSHIHLHAKTQKYFSNKTLKDKKVYLSRQRLLVLIDNLERAIKGFKWEAKNTEWADYYDKTNYSVRGFEDKKRTISEFLKIIEPNSVWDLGANNGLFSRLASDNNIFTIAFDIDPAAVEQNYIGLRKNKEKNILPLIADLFNPSPAIGWALKERMSLVERGPADVVFALALVHHLAISNNLPFSIIAEFFSRIGNSLIIEFVSKEDSQVQRLLSTRKDVFFNYDKESFEKTFSLYFKIEKVHQIEDSNRVLYLMRKIQGL